MGLTADQFWALSLKDLWHVRRAHTARLTAQRDRDVSLAWYTEAFARTKTLPNLKTLLISGKSKRQTPEEMQDVLKDLSLLYNLPLRIRKGPHAGE